MSNRYTNAAKEILVRNPIGKAVLLCVADLADEDGVCIYSDAYIAKVLELGPSTARKWLTELSRRGHLKKLKYKNQKYGGWARNQFRLIFEPIQTKPRSSGGSQIGLHHSKTVLLNGSNGLREDRTVATRERQDTCIKESYTCITPEEEGGKTSPSNVDPRIKPKDLRKEHPGIIALREATGFWPPNVILDDLIDRLTPNPDIARLMKAARAWIHRGYRPTNYLGILDWYECGVPEHGRMNGDRSRAPSYFRSHGTTEAPFFELPKSEQRPAPALNKAQKAIWKSVLDYIRTKVSPEVFSTWFERLVFDGVNEASDGLLLRANSITVDWIESYYSDLLKEGMAHAGMAGCTIDWDREDRFLVNTKISTPKEFERK